MRRLLGLLGLLLLTAGCGSGAQAEGQDATLTVFAAASLRSSFTELGGSFESSHPGVSVRFSFAGSSDLVSQLQAGAPADVFASADQKNMDKAAGEQLLQGDPTVFASNHLQIVVPRDNPGQVRSLGDLTGPGVKVVVCAVAVPCGSATRQVQAAAGVTLSPVSEESSVTDVLNKVQTGEADAGLVYVTDVISAAGKVTGVDFPEAARVVNRYPIAALAGSGRPELAREFVELVTGPQGRQVLAGAGFGPGTV